MREVTDLPREVREEETVWVTVDDGVRLAARIWRPVDSDKQPVPAILEMIPYRRRDLTSERDSIHHPYLAGHGYACVRVDLRGSGDSGGSSPTSTSNASCATPSRCSPGWRSSRGAPAAPAAPA